MEENNEHKGLTFNIIRDELNKLDPMKLYPGTICPIDEYDPEVAMILAILKKDLSYIELSKNISEIFSQMFGNFFSEKLFYNCAKKILEQLNK